ncbi:phospholipase D-like domain-containing protein [Pontiellaceae bacterium B12227]|nr:phospholipase D-like domain-containing protein [Pontiellaceae bacterium B12227]
MATTNSTTNVLHANAPKGFDLASEIKRAKEVWVVTAFAHWSGWKQIRNGILSSRAKTTLVAGLDFCQTEPRVLRDWIGKDLGALRAKAFIHVGKRTFHPKIFVVEGKTTFALVGSGNLSAGGLGNNVECFSYIDKVKTVGEIKAWLKMALEKNDEFVPITTQYIKTYEAKWKLAEKSKKATEKKGLEATSIISKANKAKMKDWSAAVAEAKKYFKSSEFGWHKDQKNAAKRILKVLHYPEFKFDKADWDEFYKIKNMGHLIPIYKYRVFRQRTKLQKSLRILADKSLNVADRVDAVLDPSKASHVTHLGINAVTKILASMEPKKYPVWNAPVKKALAYFGYESPRGASVGQKYAAYAELMKKFMKDCGAPDMLALDCFFYYKNWEINQ